MVMAIAATNLSLAEPAKTPITQVIKLERCSKQKPLSATDLYTILNHGDKIVRDYALKIGTTAGDFEPFFEQLRDNFEEAYTTIADSDLADPYAVKELLKLNDELSKESLTVMAELSNFETSVQQASIQLVKVYCGLKAQAKALDKVVKTAKEDEADKKTQDITSRNEVREKLGVFGQALSTADAYLKSLLSFKTSLNSAVEYMESTTKAAGAYSNNSCKQKDADCFLESLPLVGGMRVQIEKLIQPKADLEEKAFQIALFARRGILETDQSNKET